MNFERSARGCTANVEYYCLLSGNQYALDRNIELSASESIKFASRREALLSSCADLLQLLAGACKTDAHHPPARTHHFTQDQVREQIKTKY